MYLVISDETMLFSNNKHYSGDKGTMAKHHGIISEFLGLVRGE